MRLSHIFNMLIVAVLLTALILVNEYFNDPAPADYTAKDYLSDIYYMGRMLITAFFIAELILYFLFFGLYYIFIKYRTLLKSDILKEDKK